MHANTARKTGRTQTTQTIIVPIRTVTITATTLYSCKGAMMGRQFMIGRNYIAVLIAYIAGMITYAGHIDRIAIIDFIGFALVIVAVMITREVNHD